MKKNKICFIVSDPVTAKVFLKTPILKLSKYYDIYIAANLKSNPDFYLEGVKDVYHLPINRKISIIKDINCLIKATLFFRKNTFNAIHSITPKAGLIAMLGAYIARAPLRVHTFTGQVWANKTGVYRFLLKGIDKIIDSCTTNTLVDGNSQRDYLISQNIISQKAEVLGLGSICGVDLERFKPLKKTRQSVRAKLGFKEEDWVFMFLGRLNKEKGVEDLINAFDQINTNLDQKLVLVGHDEENIINQNKEIIKRNNITYIPFTDKPEEIIQACDTFCLPSYREGFGLSVIEASSLSKPIICSDIYGLKDTIIDRETGIKHKAKNIKDLTEKLVFALENKELLKKMGIEGRKYVSEHFSDEIVLKEWIDYYNKKLNIN